MGVGVVTHATCCFDKPIELNDVAVNEQRPVDIQLNATINRARTQVTLLWTSGGPVAAESIRVTPLIRDPVNQNKRYKSRISQEASVAADAGDFCALQFIFETTYDGLEVHNATTEIMQDVKLIVGIVPEAFYTLAPTAPLKE